MFGYLDPLKIEQSVRIIPITRFREDILGPAEPQANIDARVYTRDLTDSSSVLWQHNLERIEDGRYTFMYSRRVFWLRPVTLIDSMSSDQTALLRVPRRGCPVSLPTSWCSKVDLSC